MSDPAAAGVPAASTWSRVRDLPLRVERCELQTLSAQVSSDFLRLSTVIVLEGAGERGMGEDVTYHADDHRALVAAGPAAGLDGEWTLGGFCAMLAGRDLFAQPPVWEVSRRYRRWAYESAALDLALRQAGEALHARLGRAPAPVTFVVSLRLGEPPSCAPLHRRLALVPSLRFKLDPTSSWDDALIAELAATGAIDTLDLKGLYAGSVVDQGADPDLYRRVAEAFPGAWIEDPALGEETLPVLEPHRARITWDANIHTVADIEALPFPPRMVNLKPSRLGGVEELFAAYDHCAAHGIDAYGGGQFELGPGRGQIQYLASLFHPDAPNDVAPAAWNAVDPGPGLPASPLPPAAAAVGFRWG